MSQMWVEKKLPSSKLAKSLTAVCSTTLPKALSNGTVFRLPFRLGRARAQ